MSEAGIADAKRRTPYPSRLASRASWPRARRRARGGASPPHISARPVRPAAAVRLRQARVGRDGFATSTCRIDPAEISAEASSESRRAPTYEELWREPRRLAASVSAARAPRDRLPGWAAVVAILMGVSALICCARRSSPSRRRRPRRSPRSACRSISPGWSCARCVRISKWTARARCWPSKARSPTCAARAARCRPWR